MTICIICDKGERAGGHDPKTGISTQTKPYHKFKPDLRPDSKRKLHGFHDKYVANKHRDEKNG